MPGRKWTASNYRYSHNKQEKDDEIFEGALGAEYWEYDSRIIRRWNMDPIVDESMSSYACFNNSPILMSDPDGLEAVGPGGKKGRFNAHKRRYRPGRHHDKKHEHKKPEGEKGDGVSKHRHPSIGEMFMKFVGAFRRGSSYHLPLIPQGIMNTGQVTASGTLAPGAEKVIDFRKDIEASSENGPFMEKVTSVVGDIQNNDADYDVFAGEWVNEGPIGGYVKVDGMRNGLGGRGWHGIHLNTGLRGFMPSLLDPKQLGGILVGGELIPGGNFLDDIFGRAISRIRAFENINKTILNPRYRYTTALKVSNARFTKHNISYDFVITYRYWGQVQALDHKKDGSSSGRSKLFQKLHNVTK